MLHLTIYLDGKTSECGYKYVLTRGAYAWTAYRTDAGFRNFLKVYGLKINTTTIERRDLRSIGHGRMITAFLKDKQVNDLHFWKLEEIPATAKQTIALCNGSYVNCYVDDHGDSVDFYRPNPNAKDVYVPYDYREIQKRIG
jgi:hypothetical protein